MEKNKPNMEIVEVDGTPVDQENEDQEVKTEEKRGFFRTVGHAIAAPFRFVGRKIKENPAAAAVGGVIGGTAALGAKWTWDHFRGRKAPDAEDYVETDDLGEVDVSDDEESSELDEAM